MRRLLALIYGLAAYLAGVATLLYFIGFSGNLLVPRSVDVGAAAPPLDALLVDLLLLAAFGVQHSVMARRGFKHWWTRVVPPVVERSTFLVATCVVLAVMFRYWIPIEAPIVWRIEQSAGAALLWTVFAIGWLLVLASTFQIDHFELFGLQQVVNNLAGKRMPAPIFRTPILYKFVRHPIYLGFIIAFWAAPTMSAGHLLFAAVTTAYIFIGILLEERDLIDMFGDEYRRYRERVSMLFPWRKLI